MVYVDALDSLDVFLEILLATRLTVFFLHTRTTNTSTPYHRKFVGCKTNCQSLTVKRFNKSRENLNQNESSGPFLCVMRWEINSPNQGMPERKTIYENGTHEQHSLTHDEEQFQDN